MKKFLLILAVALLPFVASAQTDSTKTHEEYCLVTATNKLMSKKVGIKLKFKQQAATADKQIATEAAQITFTTIVDALDYMADYNWQLVTAYSDATDPTTNYYVMRRPAA